jgi:hypothetical protein
MDGPLTSERSLAPADQLSVDLLPDAVRAVVAEIAGGWTGPGHYVCSIAPGDGPDADVVLVARRGPRGSCPARGAPSWAGTTSWS